MYGSGFVTELPTYVGRALKRLVAEVWWILRLSIGLKGKWEKIINTGRKALVNKTVACDNVEILNT